MSRQKGHFNESHALFLQLNWELTSIPKPITSSRSAYTSLLFSAVHQSSDVRIIRSRTVHFFFSFKNTYFSRIHRRAAHHTVQSHRQNTQKVCTRWVVSGRNGLRPCLCPHCGTRRPFFQHCGVHKHKKAKPRTAPRTVRNLGTRITRDTVTMDGDMWTMLRGCESSLVLG